MERAKPKKQKRIFRKIFWPIVHIIILFAIVVFAVNYLSIDRFAKNSAKEKIDEAYVDISNQLNQFAQSSETEFVLKPSENLVNQSNNSRVYVFDRNYNEVALFDNSIYVDNELLNFISTLLMDYELEEDVLTTIVFGNKEYLANMYVANSSLNIKEKYFVVVQDLTDKANLLRESMRSMIAAQIIALLFALVTIYLIAKDLSKPLIRLADASKEYVIGKGVTIDKENISTTELESLRETLYKMQTKIDEETNRKNTIYENVAHDLRTPLVSILGYADGLKKDIIKDKNKACDVILRTGNQLKEMVENILILSRFDNETYKGSFEDISLSDLITEQIEMMKVIDETKIVEFDNQLNGNEEIKSDRKLLVRIIQNLLSNAIKYANSKVVIAAKTESERTDSNGNLKWTIIVKDDGKGIDENNLSNIFTRYYKGIDGHFGIGLAVVKSSVDYLSGKIEVKSEINKGTEFIVSA